MSQLTSLITSKGSNTKLQRVSKWSTSIITAEADDEKFGMTAGVKYTIWIAMSDFKTKSGSDITKGEWFAVEISK